MNISRRRIFEDEDEHMIRKNEKKKKKNRFGEMNIVEYCSSHINNIPGDLIVEILLRLPPTSVVRFRHVCKQWYSLISNTDFQRTHSSSFGYQEDQQHAIIKNDQFLVFETTRVEFVPLTPFEEEKEHHRKLFYGLSPRPPGELVELGLYSPRPRHQRFPMVDCRLIDSCNGLFLYLGFSIDKHGRSDYGRSDYVIKTFYICNPITKKYLKLPNIMDEEHKREIRPNFKTAKLVFDPSISHSYKVVMVSWTGCLVYRHTEYWHMYSSETGAWRLFSIRSSYETVTDYSDYSISVLLNGVLYWPYRKTRKTTTEDTSLFFDVEKESLGFLPLPPKPKNYFRNCNYLGKCDGRLQLIETLMKPGTYTYNCSNDSFDVMETEPQKQEDGSVCCTWMLKHRVNDIRRIDDLHTYDIVHCYKMKNRRGGENEQVLILRSINNRFDGSFYYFSLTNNKFIKELAHSKRGIRNFIENALPYTPTLFPVS